MPGPHICILMGTRNGARFLPAQLASFADQSHQDWSLIVSDDGSTDDTRAIVDTFAKHRPANAVHVRSGPCEGAAQNYLSLLGVAHTTPLPHNTVFALSDQDDVWFPDRLTRMAEALSNLSGNRPGLYAANTRLTDEELSPVRQQRVRGARTGFGNALVQNVVAGNTIGLTRSSVALLAQSLPKTSVPFHDWWIYLLLTGAGATLHYDREPCLSYRQHPHSVLGAHRGLGPFTDRWRMIGSGRYREWVAANLEALSAASDVLTADNQSLLAMLVHARSTRRPSDLRALLRAGVRRDTRLGTFMFSSLFLLGLV